MKGPSFFLFACLLISPLLYGQTSQSDMMVGGSISFRSASYQENPNNNNSDFHFSPSFGYFVKDNFAIGITMGVSRSRSGTDQARFVNTSFSTGPFARYYFFTSNEKLAFTGDAELTFRTNKSTSASGAISRGNSIHFTLSPGAAYFFNEHWAAELGFGWLSFSSYNPDTELDNDKQTFVGFSINSFSPSLGVRYHL